MEGLVEVDGRDSKNRPMGHAACEKLLVGGLGLEEIAVQLHKVSASLPKNFVAYMHQLCGPDVAAEGSKPSASYRQRDLLPLVLTEPSAEDLPWHNSRPQGAGAWKRIRAWLVRMIVTIYFQYGLGQAARGSLPLHGPATGFHYAAIVRLCAAV